MLTVCLLRGDCILPHNPIVSAQILPSAEPNHWLQMLTSLTHMSQTELCSLCLAQVMFSLANGFAALGTDDPASLELCLMLPSKLKHQRAVCQTLLL